MLFIIIPLALIGTALLVLVLMVWRKWPYLKKLEPDAHQVGDSFMHDLAPEAVEKAKSVDWRKLWHHGMNGVEESVNVFRSVFTAIGQASERLRSNIRTVKEKVGEQQEVIEIPAHPEPPHVAMPPRDDEAEQRRLLKEEEQKLILDISQDPKNVNLYIALGRVYEKLNNTADAIESLKTASKLDPDDEKITERLERLQAKQEREADAEKKELEMQEAGEKERQEPEPERTETIENEQRKTE